jgi:type I restriction-modification system DNA methylase subunit
VALARAADNEEEGQAVTTFSESLVEDAALAWLETCGWQYSSPPKCNANFAWVQHIVRHLAPAGVAGFVLANGSMSSNHSSEGEIRKNLIEVRRIH